MTTKKYQMTVRGVPESDLGALIDMIHERGGAISDLNPIVESTTAVRRVGNTGSKRSKNLEFILGPLANHRDLNGMRKEMLAHAVTYAETCENGVCSRRKFQHYIQSVTTKINATSISPTVSYLLKSGALVEVE